jgi:hypothetical protein
VHARSFKAGAAASISPGSGAWATAFVYIGILLLASSLTYEHSSSSR